MPDLPAASDLELLARWASGDHRAANELSRRYDGQLRQFMRTKVRAEEVEDLSQRVWVGLSESLNRGAAAEIRTSFRAYLFGIARHVLIRDIRVKHRLGEVEPIEQSIAALDPSLSQVVAERAEIQRMLTALQSLSVETQILLELRYFTKLSTAELAELYAVPAGTIKSRVSHARKLLEAAMGEPPPGSLRAE